MIPVGIWLNSWIRSTSTALLALTTSTAPALSRSPALPPLPSGWHPKPVQASKSFTWCQNPMQKLPLAKPSWKPPRNTSMNRATSVFRRLADAKQKRRTVSTSGFSSPVQQAAAALLAKASQRVNRVVFLLQPFVLASSCCICHHKQAGSLLGQPYEI